MTFPHNVRENLLVACHRHCCICHKSAGNKMQVHHIVPESKGGSNEEENGIPLCLDCHAEVVSYNDDHPIGTKFSSSELARHKRQWFAICASAPWHKKLSQIEIKILESLEIEKLFENLRGADIKLAEMLANFIARQDRFVREEFVERLSKALTSGDEDTRWTLGHVVEYLVLWEPRLISPVLLEHMSRDSFFSVRSSAAVCYYYLAKSDPGGVPLLILSKLASFDEDWYVASPASSAVLRLARTRPGVIDLISQGLEHEDPAAREFSVDMLKRLSEVDGDLVSDQLIDKMLSHEDPVVREAGKECDIFRKKAQQNHQIDYLLSF